jgi:hypothetical protein
VQPSQRLHAAAAGGRIIGGDIDEWRHLQW